MDCTRGIFSSNSNLSHDSAAQRCAADPASLSTTALLMRYRRWRGHFCSGEVAQTPRRSPRQIGMLSQLALPSSAITLLSHSPPCLSQRLRARASPIHITHQAHSAHRICLIELMWTQLRRPNRHQNLLTLRRRLYPKLFQRTDPRHKHSQPRVSIYYLIEPRCHSCCSSLAIPPQAITHTF